MRHPPTRCPHCGTRGPAWLPLPTGGAQLACGNPACNENLTRPRHLYSNVAPWPFGRAGVDTAAPVPVAEAPHAA